MDASPGTRFPTSDGNPKTPTNMNPQRLLQAAVLVLSVQTTQAQSSTFAAVDTHVLFRSMRNSPEQPVIINAQRIDLVNARFESCISKKEARYFRVTTPVPDGFLVRVMTLDGAVRMTGACADAAAKMPNGPFHYYDDGGTLRAEGRYVNGLKSGIWHRYDDRGAALSDKEYDGLDWQGEEVKLGMTSMSAQPEVIAEK